MRVLIVEDEPAVLRAMTKLVPAEHEVRAARSRSDALAILDEDPRFGLALVDVALGDERLGGVAVVEAVARRQPSCARAFVTGGRPSGLSREAKAFGAYVIAKPFGRAQVAWLLATAHPPSVDAEDVTREIARAVSLSPRQAHVFMELVAGANSDEIAASAGISRCTMKRHIHEVLERVRTRFPVVKDVKDLVVLVLREAERRRK